MLCNFLCSNVIWQKAASSSGGPQLSKHQSLCLNFIVNPSTKVRLGAAICRMTSCVCMELPSVLIASYFLEASAGCSCRYAVFIESRRICGLGVAHLCCRYVCAFPWPSARVSQTFL